MATYAWDAMSRPEKVEVIRAAALQGKSASQIADPYGVTRNVVIGLGNRANPRVHFSGGRVGPGGAIYFRHMHHTKPKVEKPPKTQSAGNLVLRMRALAGPKPAQVSQVVPEAPEAPIRTLATVGKHECHYPMFSDAMLKGSLEPSLLPYCGHPTEGGSYCEFHRVKMYPPRVAGLGKTT